MNVLRLMLRELVHRWFSFWLGVLAVALATTALVGSMVILGIHDIKTGQIMKDKQGTVRKAMDELQEEMRKATLELTFNILILPKDQNLDDFYANDFATRYMPEEYVGRLAASKTVVVRHFLPSLQQKIIWPEVKRTIILIGSKGEAANIYRDDRKPLVQSVPPGAIVLGYELHQTLKLKVGNTIRLMGREFTVHRCHEERGNKDDITAWIFLAEAQDLLGKKDLINSILALECVCAAGSGPVVRRTLEDLLPDTQVIEMGTRILARQESRVKASEEAQAAAGRADAERNELKQKQSRFMAVVLPLIMTAGLVWVGLLAYQNVRTRRVEIGILRAIGVRAGQIMALVLVKAFSMALLGGLTGFAAGILVGHHAADWMETPITLVAMRELFSLNLLGIAILGATGLTLLATWIPARLASRMDPAIALRGE